MAGSNVGETSTGLQSTPCLTGKRAVDVCGDVC